MTTQKINNIVRIRITQKQNFENDKKKETLNQPL